MNYLWLSEETFEFNTKNVIFFNFIWNFIDIFVCIKVCKTGKNILERCLFFFYFICSLKERLGSKKEIYLMF